MIEEIIDLIKDAEYKKAEEELQPLLSSEDEKACAHANYLMGLIHTRFDNEEKKDYVARRYLKENINSSYPIPMAFILYVDLLKDANVALNYLEKGISLFPDDERLWKKKLKLSQEKLEVVNRIINLGFTGFELLVDVIEILVNNRNWSLIEGVVNRIQNNNELGLSEHNFLDLLKAYSLIFRENADCRKAVDVLKEIITNDIDNELEYAHYVAIVYALKQLDDTKHANQYFDRIPINNSLKDLDEGPWFIVPLDLSKEYKEIFECLFKSFSKDPLRKNKAKELYALYLYYPSTIYDVHRYRKSDTKVLQRSLDRCFNKTIAEALFDMYLHMKDYVAANKVLLKMLEYDVDLDSNFILYEDVVKDVPDEDLKCIIADAIKVVDMRHELDLFNLERYTLTVFKTYVDELYNRKQYGSITQLADQLSDEYIIKSGEAFACAYSYKKVDSLRAETIYALLLEEEPNNGSVLNNLGVILEEKDELLEASVYFEKAVQLDPNDEIRSNNLSRVKKKLKEKEEELRMQKALEIKTIAEGISLKKLEELGYTDELIDRFQYVDDPTLRAILLRDFKECAIAICAGQEKSAIVMCGSMIEALLLASIQKANIQQYDMGGLYGKGKQMKNVIGMGLNELLYVADNERMIQKGNYHLSQYVRDYRNAVHPAKEIRGKQEITLENASLMWNALKRVITDLLHE